MQYEWLDASRPDPFAPDSQTRRALVVWVWYPASTSGSPTPIDYVPSAWRTARAQYQGWLLTDFLTRDLARVHGHSLADAALPAGAVRFPVLLMKAGIGAPATDYSTLAEDLASHGYVVVASDAPYSTSVVVFPDGHVVTATPAGNPGDAAMPDDERERRLNALVDVWAADMRFVLNQLEKLDAADPPGRFAGRLDLQSVGVFGHSFGGATAAEFCHQDPRCRAGIDADGAPYGEVVRTSLDRPFMFLVSDHGDASDAEDRRVVGRIQSIYDRLPKDGRAWITLRGARHFNFSDQALLKDRHLSRLFGALGPIGERRGLEAAAACIRTFFDIHLQNQPASGLRDLAAREPAVQIERR